MVDTLKTRLTAVLRWSERYTKTDMVYLASGGFWLVLEQAVGVFSSLFIAVMFGHFAGQDTYGNFKYIVSLAGLLSALSLSGLGNAVAQSTAKGFEGALAEGFWVNLRWSGPFVLGSLAVAAYYGITGNQFVAASALIVAALQPFLSSALLFNAFFTGKRDFSRSALYMSVFNIISALVVVLALFLGGRAIAIVGAYFVSRTALALYLAWRARRHARNSERDPGLFNFSAHLSLMGLIGAIGDKFDSIITFTLLGPAGLAVYTFAIAAPEQLKGVVKNMHGLAMPKFAAQPLAQIQRTIWPKIALLCLVLLGLAGLYAAAAPYLFAFLFPVYVEAVPYSQWYVFSIAFTSFTSVLEAALYAHRKTRELYISTNVGPIVLIASLVILVPAFGIAGAIASQFFYRITDAITVAFLFMRAKDAA